jgi:hypothetical protein
MPYLNKRNRFVAAAKQFADTVHNGNTNNFSKADLLAVAQSINMKGIPTWVLQDCKTITKGVYDLTDLIVAPPATV